MFESTSWGTVGLEFCLSITKGSQIECYEISTPVMMDCIDKVLNAIVFLY